MAHHSDLICRLANIAEHYETAGCGWWENQGLDLTSEPDWPGDSIMLVSWPQHVITPRFNGDCTVSGPHPNLEEAKACSKSNVEIDL